MNQPKSRILLGLFHDTSAKGILDTQAIRSLLAFADLDLIHASPMNIPSNTFNNVYLWPRTLRREKAWLALYQLHLLPFTRNYYPERLEDPNLWQGFRPYVKKILPLFDNAVGQAVLVPLLRAYLRRTNPLFSMIDRPYDAIISVSGIKDPLYEDLVRFGRAREIPIFATHQNWDNINYKPIVERPDMFGVWGMQGYYMARLIHRFQHDQVVPIGSARMDVYFEPLPDPRVARASLGLPQEKRLLLFAGAGPAFDESFIVEHLNEAIAQGQLPSDTLILYKPHPRRSKTAPAKEKPLDFSRLKHIQLVPPNGSGSVSTAELPTLLRAVDGVMSPYSTLLMEAALCGRPCLTIAYDDPNHPAIKWESYRRYIYVAPFAFAPWALTCLAKESIVPDTAQLLSLVGNEALARRAREDVLHILFHDGRDFGARVVDAVTRLLNGRRHG